ncbi:MAG: hypothetical protein R3223_05985 [Longimicrobiales bacterium]|nr:hypothetical protein [Longimicrobiales bacterium]
MAGSTDGSSKATHRAAAPAVILWLTAAAAIPCGLAAQDPGTGPSPLSLSLGGYVHVVTGIHDTGFPIPGEDPTSAFNGDVLRLQWGGSWEDWLSVDVHNRLQTRISTSDREVAGSVAGLGVTRDPGRAVDLESVWIEKDRLRVWHDLDRASVTFYTPAADLTVGRQGIAWGNSLLFPVVDLWAPFSPFELDTEVRPGIDAIRALAYPLPGLEIDAVVADRGERDPWSGGVRGTWSLASADIYGAVARIWDEGMAAGGVTWLFETTRARAEVLLPWNLNSDQWMDPRATLGFDWLGNRWTVSAEYHFNGLGTSDPDEYPSVLTSEPYARGESYFLGRHYIGGLASWTLDRDERFHLNGSVLLNVQDPSAAFFPALRWAPGQTTSVSVGGLFTLGEHPTVPPGMIPDIRSEYGTYGTLGYTRISVFF